MDKIRVLIADDHTIVRSGIRLLLQSEMDFEVVGEALDGEQALAQVEATWPDVVLMDITMPGMDGLTATRQLKARWPEIKVLVLTMHRSDEYFFEMLKAGASGYVLKGAETDELLNAIRVVARGEVFLYPAVAKKLLSDFLSRVQAGSKDHPSLSQREKEILGFLAEGYSNKEIADKLVISLSTVHTHRSKLMQKLNLSSRYELVQYARQQGMLKES